MADRIVRAVFYNRNTRSLTGEVKLRIPSSTSGQSHAATIACNDYAWDNQFTHWAQLDTLVANPGAWMVFASRGRSSRSFLIGLPSAEAAEMWLIHNVK